MILNGKYKTNRKTIYTQEYHKNCAPDVLSESEGNQVCGIITDGSQRNKTQIEMRPINLFAIKVICSNIKLYWCSNLIHVLLVYTVEIYHESKNLILNKNRT